MYRKYRAEEEWNIVEGYLNGVFLFYCHNEIKLL